MRHHFWLCMAGAMLHLVITTHGVQVTIEGSTVGTLNKEVKENADVVLNCSFTPTQNDTEEKSYEQFLPSSLLDWTYSQEANALQFKSIVEDSEVVYQPDHFALKTPASLQINNIQKSDSGCYTCTATIHVDTPSKAWGTYNLTVLVPPSIPSCQFPSDHALTLGLSIAFGCHSVEGVPTPQYTWYKDNLPLPEGGGRQDPRYSNTSYTYSKQTGTLTFSKAVVGDVGVYFCVAENKEGSEQCTAVKIMTKQDIGAIIGIVFGVIFGVLLIGILVWWTWRKGYCDNSGKSPEPKKPEDAEVKDVMLDSPGPSVH